jgi:hypothetical protein
MGLFGFLFKTPFGIITSAFSGVIGGWPSWQSLWWAR